MNQLISGTVSAELVLPALPSARLWGPQIIVSDTLYRHTLSASGEKRCENRKQTMKDEIRQAEKNGETPKHRHRGQRNLVSVKVGREREQGSSRWGCRDYHSSRGPSYGKWPQTGKSRQVMHHDVSLST